MIFLKGDFPETFNFNKYEIEETKWVAVDGLIPFIKECEANNVPITPWFKGIVRKILMKWWFILITDGE